MNTDPNADALKHIA